jgi:hypothetical protein
MEQRPLHRNTKKKKLVANCRQPIDAMNTLFGITLLIVIGFMNLDFVNKIEGKTSLDEVWLDTHLIA